MTVVTFLLLLVIAAGAAGVIVLLLGGGWRAWAAYLIAFAIVMIAPAVLPKLLGG